MTDEITDGEIVVGTYKFDMTQYGVRKESTFGGTDYWDELIKKAGLNGQELSVILRAKRNPKLVRTWWVNHYKDGFSDCALESNETPSSGDERRHGPRTHVEKREVYSDGNVVVTKEEV